MVRVVRGSPRVAANLTSYNSGAVVYRYDDENQLTWAEDVDKHKWATTFVYDGLGRLRKRVEYAWSGVWTVYTTTWYLYDGRRVIQERNASNVPQVSYTRGTDLSGTLEGAGGIGGLLGRSHGYSAGNWSTHNFYHADGNGNITYLVNSSQTLAASYRYDPFGNTISSSGTLASANVYRFSSKELHVNSGLYYYGYRWYVPNVQRWLNRDPIEESGGINLYGFIRNNPVAFTDTLGLEINGPPPCAPWPGCRPPAPERPQFPRPRFPIIRPQGDPLPKPDPKTGPPTLPPMPKIGGPALGVWCLVLYPTSTGTEPTMIPGLGWVWPPTEPPDGDGNDNMETCYLDPEDGISKGFPTICMYRCKSGATHYVEAGPRGCVDTVNFPLP